MRHRTARVLAPLLVPCRFQWVMTSSLGSHRMNAKEKLPRRRPIMAFDELSNWMKPEAGSRTIQVNP
jgi:hypothetical protein